MTADAGVAPGRLTDVRRLLRPFTWVAPMVGTACCAVVARGATGQAVPALGLACALGSGALASSASNAWNQVFDADIDRVNKPERPVAAGRMTPRTAMAWGHGCALLALALGAVAGAAFLACVSVGLLATWIYSAPPWRTKRHPVGALVTIALPRGLLVPVAGWSVVASPWVAEPWALGSVLCLFVLGAAVTKDFADVEGDRDHGCRTLPVLWGPARAARFTTPFLCLPFLALPLLARAVPLSPAVWRLDLLGGALFTAGGIVAFLLVRDPERMAQSGENHPAWAGMYLLMIGTFAGLAWAYA